MNYKKVSNVTLFRKGEEGFHIFRIPAVITLPGGRVLAFAEARDGRLINGLISDAGSIDIVMKISVDGGRTFGPIQVVVEGGGNTAGNPCPVYDRETGRVLLVFNRNHEEALEHLIRAGKAGRTVHIIESADGGETWLPERDITEETKLPSWGWHAAGPGHGLQLLSGRLVISCNHTVLDASKEYVPPMTQTIYSDDHGMSWKIGQDLPEDTNEAALAQMKDGRILMCIRLENASKHRAFAVSTDEGKSFAQYRLLEEVATPHCHGSILNFVQGDKETVLISHCSDPMARAHVIIRESSDGGNTWKDGYLVTDGPAAYSDLTQVDENHLGVLYETWETDVHERIDWMILEVLA